MPHARRRYRVLHLVTTFEVWAGAAENTKLTLNALDRTVFEPFVAIRPGQTMEAEVLPDVPRLHLRRLRRSVNPINDAAAFWDLVKLIRQHRFDVVHTHNAKDGILGRWAAFWARVPAIVHTVHNRFLRRHTKMP